jgi:hypothetical protein
MSCIRRGWKLLHLLQKGQLHPVGRYLTHLGARAGLVRGEL